jgi:hypothetical protein
MSYPAFFDQAPRITTFDPLAQFLGVSEDGELEYTYLDAVKLAGHSCPTVASAYLMAVRGLAALYPDDLPVRGAIQVSFQAARDEGVTGVIANVIGLITGAAGEEGFKGLGGRFHRDQLLRFRAPIGGEVRLATADRAVDVRIDPGPGFLQDTRTSVQAALNPSASARERQAFGAAFQARVKRLLVDRRDDPTLVSVTLL